MEKSEIIDRLTAVNVALTKNFRLTDSESRMLRMFIKWMILRESDVRQSTFYRLIIHKMNRNVQLNYDERMLLIAYIELGLRGCR